MAKQTKSKKKAAPKAAKKTAKKPAKAKLKLKAPVTTKKTTAPPAKKVVSTKKKAAAPAKAKATKAAPKTAPAPKKVTTKATKATPLEKKKAAPVTKEVLPTPAEEARFWSLIEDAWSTQDDEVNDARRALASRDPEDEAVTDIVDEALDDVIESLRAVFAFDDFPKEELVAMDRVLERKLYDIDRAEIQAVTDGSDDGFLYARGFVVALGKAFYDAVNANPKMAIEDAECEVMCYLPAEVHEERFGDFPETGSKISRESCSNRAAWDDDD